jgi:hypothetical protein
VAQPSIHTRASAADAASKSRTSPGMKVPNGPSDDMGRGVQFPERTPEVVMKRRISLGAIGLSMVLGLVACTPQQDATATAEASAGQAATCEAYDAVLTSVEDLRALDPATASVDEYRNATDEVRNAWETFLTMRGSEAAESEFELRITISDLATTLLNLPSGTTPEEAAEIVEPQVEAVQSALDSIGPEAGCGPAA